MADAHPVPDASSLAQQICAAVLILLLTVLGLWLPRRVVAVCGQRKDKYLALLSVATGAVFLAVALLHLLPEAVTDWAKSAAAQDAPVPWPCILAGVGFLTVWAIDTARVGGALGTDRLPPAKVMAVAAAAVSENEPAHICVVSVDSVAVYGSASAAGAGIASQLPPTASSVVAPSELTPLAPRAAHEHGYGHVHDQLPEPEDLEIHGAHCTTDGGFVHTSPDGREASRCTSASSHKEAAAAGIDEHEHDTVHHHHVPVSSGASLLLPFVMVALFSAHSLVEGVALGILPTSSRVAAIVLTAIVLHKTVEGVAVSTSFLQETVPWDMTWPLLTLYALMTPVGMALGVVLHHVLPLSSESLVQAFAAGSFIYLANHSMSHAHCCAHISSWTQLLVAGCTFAFIASLGALVG